MASIAPWRPATPPNGSAAKFLRVGRLLLIINHEIKSEPHTGDTSPRFVCGRGIISGKGRALHVTRKAVLNSYFSLRCSQTDICCGLMLSSLCPICYLCLIAPLTHSPPLRLQYINTTRRISANAASCEICAIGEWRSPVYLFCTERSEKAALHQKTISNADKCAVGLWLNSKNHNSRSNRLALRRVKPTHRIQFLPRRRTSLLFLSCCRRPRRFHFVAR